MSTKVHISFFGFAFIMIHMVVLTIVILLGLFLFADITNVYYAPTAFMVSLPLATLILVNEAIGRVRNNTIAPVIRNTLITVVPIFAQPVVFIGTSVAIAFLQYTAIEVLSLYTWLIVVCVRGTIRLFLQPRTWRLRIFALVGTVSLGVFALFCMVNIPLVYVDGIQYAIEEANLDAYPLWVYFVLPCLLLPYALYWRVKQLLQLKFELYPFQLSLFLLQKK